MHHGHAVAALGLVHEVGGDENRHLVAARQLHQQTPELVARHRVYARGGLIQNQQLRAVHHGHGQRQALAQAQRQLLGQLVALLLQAKALQHGFYAGVDLLWRHMKQLRVQHQVLQHGQLAVQRERLRHIAHAAARGNVVRVDLMAKQPGFAFAGRHQAGQHFHGGGFAAAVGAQKAKNLAPANAKVHVIHGHKVTKAHGEVLGLNRDVIVAGLQRRNQHLAVPVLFGLRQQGDESRLQRCGVRALQQLIGRASGQNLAVVHGHQPVKPLGFVHIGRGHQHTHVGACGADAVDQIPELRAGQRVYAGGGLVQNQQIGVVDQCAAQTQLLLHAARQLACGAREKLLQPRALRQIVNACAAFGLVVAKQAGKKLQVFFDRQGRVEVFAQALRHIGNARAHSITVRLAAHVATQHVNFAFLQLACPRQQRQQAGFAHTIRPNQAHHDAGRNVQRQAPQCHGAAIAQVYVLKVGDRRLGSTWYQGSGHALTPAASPANVQATVRQARPIPRPGLAGRS